MVRVDPPNDAPEREMLESYLDYHRATLLMKTDGVSDDDLRRPMVPSGTNLLGMVKHLAWVERGWFQECFAGHEIPPPPWTDEDPDADFRIEPDETTQQIIDLYQEACERSRAITRAADSLDQPAANPSPKRKGIKLRWIFMHMIEETARHNGHADILREMIDGATGD
jgi:uncharacterized damage-inducible protein DinB